MILMVTAVGVEPTTCGLKEPWPAYKALFLLSQLFDKVRKIEVASHGITHGITHIFFLKKPVDAKKNRAINNRVAGIVRPRLERKLR